MTSSAQVAEELARDPNKKIELDLQDYIKSGEYFNDARAWYNFQYLYPFTQRTLLWIACSIFIVPLLALILNIKSLMPIITPVRYSLETTELIQNRANISSADQINGNPMLSIVDLMLRNYITQRESYDYDNLQPQFIYIQNTSSKLVFKNFYNYMNIDNSLSPIMRYQKSIKRAVKIIAADYAQEGKATIKFETIAKNNSGEILEQIFWQAIIAFNIDEVNPKLPHNSRFNFTITDYQLKLLENKKINNLYEANN